MTNAAFLQGCLRLRLEPTGLDAMRAQAAGVTSWRALLAEAHDERVLPLLHHTVGGRGILPPAVDEAAHQSYRRTGLRNILLLRELEICLRALAEAAVPVIVLKGAVLAELVYDNIALRPMGDIDLLVRGEDLAAARRAIEALGYQQTNKETQPGMLERYENELALYKPGRVDTYVDLHWSLFDSPHHQRHIGMEWFWETAAPARIRDVPTQMLGPAAMLIHLAGHLALHHASSGLLWWHDIAEVIAARRAAIDWAALAVQAQQSDLLVPVRTVLERVALEWGAPVPPAALDALRARAPSPGESQALARLSDNAQPAGLRFWADLRSLPDWGQRLHFARAHVFPSADYMRQRYHIRHPLLLPLSYPWRWLRGLLGLR